MVDGRHAWHRFLKAPGGSKLIDQDPAFSQSYYGLEDWVDSIPRMLYPWSSTIFKYGGCYESYHTDGLYICIVPLLQLRLSF